MLTRRVIHRSFRGLVSVPKPRTPEEMAQDKEEAAKLAMQSIKDIGSMFSNSEGKGDDTEPIDSRPIFKEPSRFATLSLLHQGQVLNELQQMYDKDWHKLTLEAKQLGYYIGFGNWGSRDKFDNWNKQEPPYDLPYPTPSKLQTNDPKPQTLVHPIDPPVNLALHPIRVDQFNPKRLDGVTKFFIYLTLVVAAIALYRDKFIGEAGRPLEIVIVDPYEEERKAEQARERIEEDLKARLELEKSKSRKWYYLWIK
ncbi:uncharacterized protein KQ657_004679 [Scheffersomyces spartinae]|uniref:Genetic interactor of prohibitin 7, mitochondrial n=1 Tax=Scheffersomyces spartinae TaxID=45513 RepID=A0A9P7VBG8_9ASCO|nr:uncharacterized protein KQ657_004679 [Scheffersomyces spartinae]KAG7194466.1 hypothetical protein KQ657_004679 [Scheffersomyces spartinae]